MIRILKADGRVHWFLLAGIFIGFFALDLAEHWPLTLARIDLYMAAEMGLVGCGLIWLGTHWPPAPWAAERRAARPRQHKPGLVCVLVTEKDRLLGSAISKLLSSIEGLQILGTVARSEGDLMREIERWQPDVLFLDKDARLVEPLKLLMRFRNCSGLRVVSVSANEPVAEVFDRARIRIDCTDDLLGLLRSEEPGLGDKNQTAIRRTDEQCPTSAAST